MRRPIWTGMVSMPTPMHRPPASLRGRWFTTEQALAAGVHRKQLSGPRYVSILPRVWCCPGTVPEAGTPEGIVARLPALHAVYPNSIGSHLTAAIVLELRLPRRANRNVQLHLTRDGAANPPRGRGIVGHEAVLEPADVWSRHGVHVTGPARTLLDLAAMRTATGYPLLSDDQLVGVIDGVVNQHSTGYRKGRPALREMSELVEDLRRCSGRRGIGRLRPALARAAVGVDSVLETRARLLLWRYGLGSWVTDLELSVPGHRLVWPDLADPVHRISLQLEGPHHDERRQRIRDIERQRATEAAGWTEIRVVAADLETGPMDRPGSVPRLVGLVRAARARTAPR